MHADRIKQLADDYAEQRHVYGSHVYNAKTETARAALHTAVGAALDVPDDVATQVAKAEFKKRWDNAAARTPDQSVTPEFLEWLQTVARREGVASNEAWNAGVAVGYRQGKIAAEQARQPHQTYEAQAAIQGGHEAESVRMFELGSKRELTRDESNIYHHAFGSGWSRGRSLCS